MACPHWSFADRVSAYYLAKQVADQPVRIASLLLYAAIIYWMVRAKLPSAKLTTCAAKCHALYHLQPLPPVLPEPSLTCSPPNGAPASIQPCSGFCTRIS